jgi:hypothetical protein
MKCLLIVAAVTLAVAPAATAGKPYTFSDRAAFEKYVKAAGFYRGMKRDRAKIRTLGCAKAGVGRAVCAVVTLSPTKGQKQWAVTLSCPSEAITAACRWWWNPVEIRS